VRVFALPNEYSESHVAKTRYCRNNFSRNRFISLQQPAHNFMLGLSFQFIILESSRLSKYWKSCLARCRRSRLRVAAFPSSGRRDPGRIARLKQEGSSRGRGEDLAARSALHPRYDLWPSRSWSCPVGWPVEQNRESTHAFQEPSAWCPRPARKEEPQDPERSAGPDYAEGVMDGLICEI